MGERVIRVMGVMSAGRYDAVPMRCAQYYCAHRGAQLPPQSGSGNPVAPALGLQAGE
jgi:hypothetical protein